MNKIYFDNAATSFPKPVEVTEAMVRYLQEVGAPLNRSGYQSAWEAEMVTLSLRERLKRFFSFPEKATHVVLTPGNTFSINYVLKGYLRPGDHVIISGMEHNAVMRTLRQLTGVSFDPLPADSTGRIDPENLPELIRSNTRLIIMTHGSNVSGSVLPAERIGQIAKAYGIPFVLDGAQTAGHYPLSYESCSLSALCVPAHKGLLGPSGIGALLISEGFAQQVSPLIAGGTGSISDKEQQPEYLPDRFESGTMNLPGIYGWEAAMAYIEQRGLPAILSHERALTKQFIEGLSSLHTVRLCGPLEADDRVGVLSLDFRRKDNGAIAYALEQEYGILTRSGLHCAPAAHRSLGTFPKGTVRFSLGYANTSLDVETALSAIEALQ